MDEVFSKTLAFAKEYRHIAKDTPVELSMKLHVVNVKTLSRLLGDVETIVQVLDTQTSVQIDLSLGEAVVRMLLTIPQGIWMVDEIDSRGQYPPYLAEEKRVAINQLEQRHYYGGHYPTNELMDLLDVLLEPEPEAGDVEPEPESEEPEPRARLVVYFAISKHSILNLMRRRIPGTKNVNTLLFFLPESCLASIAQLSFRNCKKQLFGDGDRCLVLHVDQIQDFIGPYMGMIRISGVSGITEKIKSFTLQKLDSISLRRNLLERGTMIRNIPNLIIPEQLLFSHAKDATVSSLSSHLAPIFLGMTIVSISTEACLEGDTWSVTIRGRRLIEAKLTLKNGQLHMKSGKKDDIIDSKGMLPNGIELFRFYHWMFKEGDFDKIALARDITSSLAPDMFDVLQDSAEIFQSALSNYSIYLKKVTDKFLETRKSLTDYIFEHFKELIGFQVSLTSRMSTDTFRIIGSLVLFGIGAFSDFLSEDLNPVFIVTGLTLIFAYVCLSVFLLRDIRHAFEASRKRNRKHLEYYKKFVTKEDIRVLEPELEEVRETFERRYYVYNALLLSGAAVLLEIAVLFVLGV